MRPSDENQGHFTRPNLMSSLRRGGDEDSILARLERDPGRRGGAGMGVRIAWYGAAAMVAIGLTATLAWLAAGNGVPAPELAPGAPPAAARAGEPGAPPEAARVPAALIVDALPEPAAAPVLAAAPAPPAPPALRLLEPVAARPAPVKVAPDPVRVVAKPAPRGDTRRAAASGTRGAPRAPAPRQAARPARSVNPARGEVHDDSDVALISAVIYHANGHAANEAAQDACADDACRPQGR